MPARTLPGLGLKGFWPYGTDGYNDEMDENQRKTSVFVQTVVLSRETSLPGSPSDGDIYIVPEGDTNEHDIAVRDDGAWVYYSPFAGCNVFVLDEDIYVRWTGSAWISTEAFAADETTVSVGSRRITNVAAPSSSTDAAPVGWVTAAAAQGGLAIPEVPVVTSIAALRLRTATAGRAIRLVDAHRDTTYIYDSTVTVAWCNTDPQELVLIAHVPGEDGAWVDPMSDPRLGLWANSATPARKKRSSAGMLVGPNVARYYSATNGNQDGEFWADEVSDGNPGVNPWSYVFRNALNIFERDNGSINTALLSRSHPSNGSTTIGLTVSVVNRDTDDGKGWAIYSDAISEAGATGHNRNAEFNVVSFDAISNTGGELPYTDVVPGLRYCLGLAAGGDVTIHGATEDVDHAIRVNQNGARFWTAIMVRNNALVVDGNSESRFAALAEGHSIVWYGDDNDETARILSRGDGSGYTFRQVFANAELRWEAGGARIMQLLPTASGINYFGVRQGAASQPVKLEASGADIDIDMMLIPKNAGLVRTGYNSQVHSSFAVGQVNRVLRVKDGANNIIELFGRVVT